MNQKYTMTAAQRSQALKKLESVIKDLMKKHNISVPKK